MSRNVPEPRMCFIENKAEQNHLPIKSLYFVLTFPSGIIKFESKERAMLYSHDCIALRNLVNNIHFMHDGAERDRRWREEWLSLVEDFKQHWVLKWCLLTFVILWAPWRKAFTCAVRCGLTWSGCEEVGRSQAGVLKTYFYNANLIAVGSTLLFCCMCSKLK